MYCTGKTSQTHFPQNLVSLNTDEIPQLVKVLVSKFTPSVQLGAELPANFHDVLEHLVVVLTSKENLARVELIQGAADGPHVDGIVKRHAQDDLGRTVESTDKIWHGLGRGHGGIRTVDCRAEIADFEVVPSFVYLGIVSTQFTPVRQVGTYQNVVGLQVSVDNTALAHVAKRQEDLVRIGPRSVEVDADVVSKLF